MKKNKGSNKGEKAAPSVNKAINWDALPEKDIAIMHDGKLKKCGKPSAKLLVNKGLATLA